MSEELRPVNLPDAQASTMVPPRIELSYDAKLALMCQIKRLIRVFDDHATDPYGAGRRRREDIPNSTRCQTEDGLYLEFYYNAPHSLWTPWGKWTFLGTGCEVNLEGF